VPVKVFEFLMRRLDLAGDIDEKRKDFHPLPYTGFRHGLPGISSSPNYKEILKKVMERALSPKPHEYFWIPKLFSEISGGFSAECIEALRGWAESGDKNKIQAVAYLLEDAPPGFLFSHAELISGLLESAYRINDDCYRNVRSYLQRPAFSETRTGTPGQPMPQDVRLKEQAMGLIKRFPAGSPTHEFYSSLIRRADASIQDDLARDEELSED
jgi:hypothetical protein